MFLKQLIKRNKKLVDFVLSEHAKGKLEPDTYFIDADTVYNNALLLKEKADQVGIELYQMTKQFGRNPFIANKIKDAGIDKAVCVDWKEAEVLYKNGINIGNIGHIVQVPKAKISTMLKMKPKVWTIFSYENAFELNEVAKKQKVNQDIILRVYDKDSLIYPSQEGGFNVNTLDKDVKKILSLSNVKIVGLTSFPTILFNEKSNSEEPTPNYFAIQKAVKILEKNKIKVKNINLPSANNVRSIELIKKLGGNSGEPGHAFTGTTPISSKSENVESPAMLYYSTVSHISNGKVVAFAGGHYRRGRQVEAAIGNKLKMFKWIKLADEAIDYYYEFELGKNKVNIGDSVLMSFRTQIFVTRSKVAVIEGLSKGKPKIVGIYDSQGNKIE